MVTINNMATINIKPSTVVCTEKVAAEICSILAANGVSFEFIPEVNPNATRDGLLSNINWTVRSIRILKIACESVKLDYETVKISQFVTATSRNEMIKIRNCGKRALDEIASVLWQRGFRLA